MPQPLSYGRPFRLVFRLVNTRENRFVIMHKLRPLRGELRYGAIGESGQETREGECVLCMTCQKMCPENSIAFRRKQSPEQRNAVDLSKRSFLLTGVLGAGVAT